MGIEEMIRGNDEAPHRAIIWIEASVHELLQTGECNGNTKFAITRFPVVLDGADKFIAIRKLNELLAEVKEKCKNC